MFEILTAEQMYEADRKTIDAGTTGDVLMENAGAAVVAEIVSRWTPRSVAVLCGPGNNGGDGFVIARHLAIRGVAVQVALLAPPADLTGDAKTNFEIIERMGLPLIDLSNAEPRFLSDELARTATLIVTMGCGEACPAVPGLRRDDWPLEDPKGKPIERVREIRDDVKARVESLLRVEGWGPSAS